MFSDFIKGWSIQVMEEIASSRGMFCFLKSAWICAYPVFRLKVHDLDENKVNGEEQRLRKTYKHEEFANERFSETSNMRCRIVIVEMMKWVFWLCSRRTYMFISVAM